MSDVMSNRPPVVDLYAALEPVALGEFLTERFQRHTLRADELGAAYKRFLFATTAGIPDDAVLSRAVDFKEQLRAAVVDCEATRVAIKEPVLAAGRQIDGKGREINQPLVDARVEVERRCTEFLAAKDRTAREAARIEAERLAAEAALLVDKASENESSNEETLARAAAIAEEAEAAAAITEAPAAELTRVRTSFGNVAALRDHWVMTGISDITKVPVHFLIVNKQAVDLAIRQGMRECPGLIIENQRKIR
jgi:hypothetical protein